MLDRTDADARGGYFTHWPSVSEIKKLLRPHFEELQRTLRALEAIAKAKPTTVIYGNTGSKVAYQLPPPPPEQSARHLSKRDDESAGNQVRIDPAAVDAQLHALGYTRDTVPPLQPCEPKR